MRVLLVGSFREWVSLEPAELELRTAASAAEAIDLLSAFAPELMVVDPALVADEREALVRHAEPLGCIVIAGPRSSLGVRIPGSTIRELERYAIVETLRSVGGSTSKAAKVLGISVRKIQYRLRDWKLSPAQILAEGAAAAPEARH
jgi:hypothetical protein